MFYYSLVGFGSFIFLIAFLLSLFSFPKVCSLFMACIFSSYFLNLFLTKNYKFGRSFKIADMSSPSVMSKFLYIRYMISIMAILCCLLLPWTVKWVPDSPSRDSFSHLNFIIRETTTKSPILASHIKNYAYTKANSDFQIYYGDTYIAASNHRKKNNSRLNARRTFLRNADNKHVIYNHKAKLFNRFLVKPFRANEDLLPSANLTEYSFKNENSNSLKIYYFELHLLIFNIAILSCSSFIQLYFYFKLLMMFSAIIIYIVGLN